MKRKGISKRLAGVLALSLALVMVFGISAYANTLQDQWGDVNEGTSLTLNTPVALAKDKSGNIFVSDMSNHRIVKLDQSGKVIKKFGKLGTGDGEFNLPFGVTIDNRGNILVADTANYRIQKFDANWNFIGKWGSKGTDAGQFGLPREIGVDSNNHYHVTDEFNHRIEVFDENGIFLYQYGGIGTSNGQFRLPQGISVKQSASGDRVYIADTYNQRIQILDVNGNYISQIGKTGVNGDSSVLFNYPRGVNVDASGDVYVSDTTNHKIKKYNSAHQYQYATDIGISRLEPCFPSEVLSLDNGYFIVSDTGNSQLVKYRAYSTYATVNSYFGKLRNSNGVFSEPVGVAVDSSQNVYVSDTFNHRIQKFDMLGNLIGKWGGSGGAGGPDSYGNNYWQFIAPKQVTYDKLRDQIVIADTGNSRIQIFMPDGTWVANFGYVHLLLPVGVTVASDGNYYVADTGENRIVVFNGSGQYVKDWGTEGLGNGQFRQPTFITCDSQDNIYVADRINNRIQKFDKNGNFIAKWGANGGVPTSDPLMNWSEGDGELFLPIGVAIDSNDNVLVADSSNNRVQKFSKDGVFLERMGQFGGFETDFFSPQGIAFGSNGEIYIADTLLNRVVIYK